MDAALTATIQRHIAEGVITVGNLVKNSLCGN